MQDHQIKKKHIDTQYHFVREYIENGSVKVIYIRSDKNKADPFTKNIKSASFKKHFDPMFIGPKNSKSGRLLK